MPPHIKFEYDFFRAAFEHEFTRLESLRGRGSWLCSQLTLLGGASYYLAAHHESAAIPILNSTFWLLWLFGLVRFTMALWHMFSFIRLKLENADPGAPLPLYQWARDIEVRNGRVNNEAMLDIEEHLMRDFARRFAVCADRNYRNNHKRTILLTATTEAASEVLFSLCACSIFLLF